MNCYEQQTTTDLIDQVLQDNYASDREIVLVSRLMGALEEIDVLHKEVVSEARRLAASIHGDA
jgi:hypothetical protein